MSVKRDRQDVQHHRQEIARLQQEKSQEATKAAEAIQAAKGFAEDANRNRTFLSRGGANQFHIDSTVGFYVQQSQWQQDEADRCRQRIADIEAKIAQEQEQLDEAQNRLARSQGQRMKAMSGKLARHDRLHAVALSAIEKLQNLPEEIAVLFFAANPFNQQELRLDEEVRAIGEMIRKSKHRDSVRLESRWAVRPLDVLQAINECRPRIVHFSGHGSDRDEIVFQDNAGQAKLVSKEAIAQTMAAASGDIQLAFFNTCYSRGQAEAVVQHIPAAIGMNTSIVDDAARVFSAQFYSAIGFGLSVGLAFRQAKAALLLEGIPEDSTPELFVTAGLDVDDLVLVQPAATDATATI